MFYLDDGYFFGSHADAVQFLKSLDCQLARLPACGYVQALVAYVTDTGNRGRAFALPTQNGGSKWCGGARCAHWHRRIQLGMPAEEAR